MSLSCVHIFSDVGKEEVNGVAFGEPFYPLVIFLVCWVLCCLFLSFMLCLGFIT